MRWVLRLISYRLLRSPIMDNLHVDNTINHFNDDFDAKKYDTNSILKQVETLPNEELEQVIQHCNMLIERNKWLHIVIHLLNVITLRWVVYNGNWISRVIDVSVCCVETDALHWFVVVRCDSYLIRFRFDCGW